LVRDFFIAFLAMSLVSLTSALPASTKQRAIRKLVSELFEEGRLDVRVKSIECQGPINNLTRWNAENAGRSSDLLLKSRLRRRKIANFEQQQHD
jgi:hypothetical protein